MSEKKLYRVINPVSYMGSRFERGDEIAMTEADAHNIGKTYVAPVNHDMSDDTQTPTEVPEAPATGAEGAPEGEAAPEAASTAGETTPAGEYEPETAPEAGATAPATGAEGEQVNG